MTISRCSTRRRPPKQYEPWFMPYRGGLWILIGSALFLQKVKVWKEGKGKRLYWSLMQKERKQINKWLNGAAFVSYGCCELMSIRSGWTLEYWLGPKPEMVTPPEPSGVEWPQVPHLPSPPPEPPSPKESPKASPKESPKESPPQSPPQSPKASPKASPPPSVIKMVTPPEPKHRQIIPDESRQQRVDKYWVKDMGGHLVLAEEYLEDFLVRVDDLLGANMTGWGRFPKSDTWKGRRGRWRRRDARPLKSHILELCLWTGTKPMWWLTGEGDIWAIKPPELPTTIQMTPRHSRDYPAPTPPDKPPRAKLEESQPPQIEPSEPAPYNFFAGCNL